MSDTPAPQPEPSLDDFFDEINDTKQRRYDCRVSWNLCRLFRMKPTEIRVLEREANAGAGPQGGFTPDWLSARLSCPVTFRAIKDWRINRKSGGFPDPLWLFYHDIDRSMKYRALWKDLWLDTVARFRGSGTFVAAVFRPAWSIHNVVLHDYEPIWLHGFQEPDSVRQFAMFRRLANGVVVMQDLEDMVRVLRDYWTPAM